MLTRLELRLESKEELANQMAPFFHGALMEKLPEEYAWELHQSKLHPYAQHLEMRDRQWYWVVTCLEERAAEWIIGALKDLETVEIRKKKMVVGVADRKLYRLSHQELMEAFYREEASRYLQVRFLTPTAFKQQGRYLFYPDLRCVYQSLMNKFDLSTQEETMADEDTLEQLREYSEIVRYRLQSASFPLEGVKIPSFLGTITVKVKGSQTMANFARALFRFGGFSGVGIKTALGMGAIQLLEKGEGKGDRRTD